MGTVTVEMKIVTETCCECGILFGMPDYLVKRLKTEGGAFYCPNGHGQHYVKPENVRLSEEIKWYRARLKEDRAELQATKNSLRATKAAHTRTKNRIKNGVCPCCNRHFENLHRHMQTKHPEYHGS